jgi:archaellum component FlaF (FlaF/FlaG flagellin family)
MGFADLAAQVVLVFIFIIVFVSLFTSYKSYVESASSNTEFIYKELNDRIQTDVEIIDSNYSSGTINLTVENTGSTTLDKDLVDVFVNGEKMNRSVLTLTIYNQAMDNLYWNPTEYLNISFSETITGRSLVQVSTQFGISAYEQVEP